MTSLKKTLAFLFSLPFFITPLNADAHKQEKKYCPPNHKHHGYDNTHDNDRNYAWYDHSNRHEKLSFDYHVPKNLKHSRKHLPLMIVIDKSGYYRGQNTESFFVSKASREGFVLAYTYDSRGPYHPASYRDEDRIVNSILNALSGSARIDTNRIRIFRN